MTFKVIAIVCLVAVAIHAAPQPTNKVVQTNQVTPNKGGAVGNLVGGVLGTVGGLLGGVLDGTSGIVKGALGNGAAPNNANGKADLSLNLPGLLNTLAGGVTNVGGNAGSILKDLSKLKIPGTVDDVLNLVTGVGATVGEVLDAVVPGTGAPVGNLVLGLVKVLICGLGSPGLTGDLLGDKRPGYNNPKDIPAVCNPKYGSTYGLKNYNGGYKNMTQLYNHYNIAQIDEQLRQALNKYTNGKGLDGLKGSNYYVVKWILELSSLGKSRCANEKWSKADTTKVIQNLGQILGAIGNGYKNNLGNRIVIQLIKYCKDTTKNDAYFKNTDWDKYQQNILNQIAKCKQADFNGAIKKQDSAAYNAVQNDQDVNHTYAAATDTTGTDTTGTDTTATGTTGTDTTGTDTTGTDTTGTDTTGTDTTGTDTTGTDTTGTDTTGADTTGTVTTGTDTTGTDTTGTTTGTDTTAADTVTNAENTGAQYGQIVLVNSNGDSTKPCDQ